MKKIRVENVTFQVAQMLYLEFTGNELLPNSCTADVVGWCNNYQDVKGISSDVDYIGCDMSSMIVALFTHQDVINNGVRFMNRWFENVSPSEDVVNELKKEIPKIEKTSDEELQEDLKMVISVCEDITYFWKMNNQDLCDYILENMINHNSNLEKTELNAQFLLIMYLDYLKDLYGKR